MPDIPKFLSSHSPQEAPPGSGNSCHNPRCIAGIGVSSLSQHDSQVTPIHFSLIWIYFVLLPHTSNKRLSKYRGESTNCAAWDELMQWCLCLSRCASRCSTASNNTFSLCVLSPSCFSWPVIFSYLIVSLSGTWRPETSCWQSQGRSNLETLAQHLLSPLPTPSWEHLTGKTSTFSLRTRLARRYSRWIHNNNTKMWLKWYLGQPEHFKLH